MTFGFSRIFWATLITCGVLSAQAQGLRLPGAAATATTDGASTQRASDYIVAIVNTEPITNQQVRQEMQRMGLQLTQQQVPVPPADVLAHLQVRHEAHDWVAPQFSERELARLKAADARKKSAKKAAKKSTKKP